MSSDPKLKKQIEEIKEFVREMPCNTGLSPCPCLVCAIRGVLAGEEPVVSYDYETHLLAVHVAVDQFLQGHRQMVAQITQVKQVIGTEKWEEIVGDKPCIESTD